MTPRDVAEIPKNNWRPLPCRQCQRMEEGDLSTIFLSKLQCMFQRIVVLCTVFSSAGFGLGQLQLYLHVSCN